MYIHVYISIHYVPGNHSAPGTLGPKSRPKLRRQLLYRNWPHQPRRYWDWYMEVLPTRLNSHHAAEGESCVAGAVTNTGHITPLKSHHEHVVCNDSLRAQMNFANHRNWLESRKHSAHARVQSTCTFSFTIHSCHQALGLRRSASQSQQQQQTARAAPKAPVAEAAQAA